jgi:RIO kinase 1
MEFIGENGVSAPLLKESSPRNPEKLYEQLLASMEKLYQKAGLVHADLSEYNIMLWKSKPVVFDFGQAVLVSHPMANRFLRRDLENLFQYFHNLNISVLSVDETYRRIINV